MSALDHFNYINNLLPRINEQSVMTVGHKDRRGIFVSEADRDGLLRKLGIKPTQHSASSLRIKEYQPERHLEMTMKRLLLLMDI